MSRWLERVPRPPRRRREGGEDGEERPLPEPIGEHGGLPLVMFIPVRCPFCGAPKPITDGVRDLVAGRIRYHRCRGCGAKFRSKELDSTKPTA